MQIKPSSVSQISSSGEATADKAVDDDMETICHTHGYWDTLLWYKMSFNDNFCFSEVVIIQSHPNYYALRMEDAKIFVVDTNEGREYLCGVLKTTTDYTVEGQTYKFPCDGECGNEVKVTLLHESGKYDLEAIIHMKEIMAYISSG